MDPWHLSTLIGMLILAVLTCPRGWIALPYLVLLSLGIVVAFVQPIGSVTPLWQARQLSAARFVITWLLFRML